MHQSRSGSGIEGYTRTRDDRACSQRKRSENFGSEKAPGFENARALTGSPYRQDVETRRELLVDVRS
eukprot:4876962-Prymnesium_polylepis.2